jgi:Asp-tRNA(Asn)/Glu-tRNA(Gln) amidotransferase A subunit family amidase
VATKFGDKKPVRSKCWRTIDVNAMKVLAPCRAISVLRLPAAAVPAGRSAEGLPVGVQVVGPRGADGRVLAVAELIERELSGG